MHDSIKRSREGIRAVSLSLAVLGLTAVAQTVVFLASGSIALLADLIHNYGDALTAVPLGIAFAVRSELAERRAGLAVVAAIFISACVAGVEAVLRLIHPTAPTHLAVLALAGAIGYAGNFVAARIRLGAGQRLDSPALVADGHHAQADAYVSLAVIASAIVVALGVPDRRPPDRPRDHGRDPADHMAVVANGARGTLALSVLVRSLVGMIRRRRAGAVTAATDLEGVQAVL